MIFSTQAKEQLIHVTTSTILTKYKVTLTILKLHMSHSSSHWRGRPPTVATIRWSGTREELEELTQLAERHGSRYNRSDVAKKIWSAYNSISRYAAWPGTW